MSLDLSRTITESRNPASENIDELSTEAMLRVINNEDKRSPGGRGDCAADR